MKRPEAGGYAPAARNGLTHSAHHLARGDTAISTAANAADISLPVGVDLEAVQEAIVSRNWLLRFPPRLEAMFEHDTGPQRCRELIIRAYIGIIIYDLFAIADWWATPELFSTALGVRLVFFTPLALVMTVVLYT
jgi:hypothetical protein